MTNWKNASSYVGGQLVGVLLSTSETPVLTAASGTGIKVSSFILNNQGADTNVWVSRVKSGGSAGSANRVLTNYPLAAGQVFDVAGPTGFARLDEGDFLSAKVDTGGVVSLTIDGDTISNTTAGVASGIQTDAIGTGGHGTAGTVSGSIKIGTAPNRRLVSALLVQENGATAGWASYTGGGPTLSCTDGPMTRKVSIDFNNGGSIAGSIHLFTYDNPISGSTQTISGAAAATGATMGLVLASKSYYGVNLSASLSTVSTGPVGAATLSLPFTTAAGHVPVFAGAFFDPPRAHNMSTIRFDGVTAGSFTLPQWLIMADQFGVSSLTATLGNSTQHCAVGFDMTPA